MKKVIITGATGYIGSNLANRLLSLGYEVYAILRKESNDYYIKDFRSRIKIFVYDNDINRLIEYFQMEKFDAVFHLAAQSITEHKSSDIDGLIKSNILFLTHILEAMSLSETKILINTGTAWQDLDGEKYNPVCLYAATKEANEKIIEFYVKVENISVITLKLTDTYGPLDKRNKVINLFNKIALNNEELDMTEGEQYLDLLYIEDVIDGFIVALDRIREGGIYNEHNKWYLSSGNPKKLRELAKEYESLNGEDLKINWGKKKYRKREIVKKQNHYKLLPGWKPKYSIEEGLKEVISSNKKKKVKLSICIPTYNRANRVFCQVKELLKNLKKDMEIIVSDNASTDDTKILLESIHDDRLIYTRNSENIGYKNITVSLYKANGEYVFTLSDEEIVDFDAINDVLEILQANPEVGMVLSSIFNGNTNEYDYKTSDRRITKGRNALRNIGYMYGNMNGIILKKDLIDFNNPNIDGFLPHMDIITMMCLKTDVITCEKVICKIGKPETWNLDSFNKYFDKPYYHIESVVDRHQWDIDLINSLNLNNDDKLFMYLRIATFCVTQCILYYLEHNGEFVKEECYSFCDFLSQAYLSGINLLKNNIEKWENKEYIRNTVDYLNNLIGNHFKFDTVINGNKWGGGQEFIYEHIEFLMSPLRILSTRTLQKMGCFKNEKIKEGMIRNARLKKHFDNNQYLEIIDYKSIESQEVYYYVGRAYIRLNQYNEGINYMEKYIERLMNKEKLELNYVISRDIIANAYYQLGFCYYKTNNLKRAKDNFIICDKISFGGHGAANKMLEKLRKT